MSLFNPHGRRLYLTRDERDAFLNAAGQADRDVRTFCMVLAYTGCRISEALTLTAKSVDFDSKALVFETLKKRKSGVFRAVPIPDLLLDALDMVHGLKDAARGKGKPGKRLLWPWSRATAWRRVIVVMEAARIPEGPHRCPKGLRHGYGVAAVTAGIPLNMVSKWMGHSSLEITAIYANALGEEQRHIASRMWG